MAASPACAPSARSPRKKNEHTPRAIQRGGCARRRSRTARLLRLATVGTRDDGPSPLSRFRSPVRSCGSGVGVAGPRRLARSVSRAPENRRARIAWRGKCAPLGCAGAVRRARDLARCRRTTRRAESRLREKVRLYLSRGCHRKNQRRDACDSGAAHPECSRREIHEAAEQQRRITRRRLEKLLSETQ